MCLELCSVAVETNPGQPDGDGSDCFLLCGHTVFTTMAFKTKKLAEFNFPRGAIPSPNEVSSFTVN